MTPTREHRLTAYLIVNGQAPSDADTVAWQWLDNFVDGGPPLFEKETTAAWLIAKAEYMAVHAATAPLIKEIADLNFKLGKALGELEGQRLIVTPYEAWEQGYGAHKGQKNPYPYPKESP